MCQFVGCFSHEESSLACRQLVGCSAHAETSLECHTHTTAAWVCLLALNYEPLWTD